MSIEIKKIDLTPTWEYAFKLYIDMIENGRPKAKKIAWEGFRDEALRLAKEVDKQQAK